MLLAALFVGTIASAGSALAADDSFVVIKAGRIIPVAGDEIENGMIVVRNGKIEAVGKNVEIPRGAKRIDASDMTVMPGLVNVRTRGGLDSYRRNGTNGQLTAAEEIYAHDEQFEDLREAGFTTAALYPLGSGIPGRASAVRPIAGSRDEVVVEENAYTCISFTRPANEKNAIRGAFKQAQAEIDKVEKARKAWEEKQKKAAEEAKKKAAEEGDKGDPKKEPEKQPEPKSRAEETPKKGDDKGKDDAKKEPEKFEPPQINPAVEPLVDLLREEDDARSVVEISRAEGVLHFEDVIDDYDAKIAHDYLVANTDSGSQFFTQTDVFLVAKQLGEAKATVALMPNLNTVPYTNERVSIPLELQRAGCSVVFFPAQDSEQGYRSFLGSVGTLVRWGFPREAALEAVTSKAAAMLGLEERLGTIEAERDANLIFLDGDPFAPFTEIKKVMIEGKVVAEPETKP